jgi:CHAT domain-containing protein/tetratricopeptide (TPR) repeat protein
LLSFRRVRHPSRIALILLLGLAFAALRSPAAPYGGASQNKAGLEAGEPFLQNGDYAGGIALINDRLKLTGLLDRDRLRFHRQLVFLYWYADQDQEALASSLAALRLASELGLGEETVSLKEQLELLELYSQGIDLKAKRDIPGSNRAFERALAISRSIKSAAHELKILRAWSSNYLGSAAVPKEYLDLNLRALDLARSLGYKLEACRAENNLGAYYHTKGSLSYALSHYLRAYSQIRDLRPSDNTLKCLNNIALIRIAIGDYSKARDDLSEALRLIDAKDPGTFRSSLIMNLGQTLLSLAQRFQAPEYYEQALEYFASFRDIQKRTGGGDISLHVLNGMAMIYADQGRLDEARETLLPARASAQADTTLPLSGMIMLSLGSIALRSGQADEAEQYFKQALDGARQGNDYLRMIRAFYGLGRCAELRGSDDLAVSSYNDAIRLINENGRNIVNDVDRAEFIGRSREPFQALIDLYYRLSRKAHSEPFEREIFRVAENLRARSFLEHLETQPFGADPGRPEPAAPEGTSLVLERLDLLRQLARNTEDPDKTLASSLQSRIKRIDELLDASVFDRQPRPEGPSPAIAFPVSLGFLQSAVLPNRTALLEYFLGDERSFLICVTKESFRLVELPSARSIEDSLTAYLSFLEDPSMPAGKGVPAAQRLYLDLVHPALASVSPDIDRLIIVPDGILFRLPFEALVPDVSGSSSPTYLNDLYVISYAPSASSLFYLKRLPKVPHPKEVLAFGVSQYGTSGRRAGAEDMASAFAVMNDIYERSGFALGPIPHSRREVESLAGRAPREKVDLYFGERATEAELKSLDLGAYRLIHIAGHALSDGRYPLRSSLVLFSGGNDQEDGFLQASEMYKMKTSADLVVLSACQTGGGKIARNEGISGLPRVFFYMGARSVISTLWPIHDKAAASFMDHFYDSYFRGAGKAEALQAAKKKMARTRYAHPYFWAAYTLAGQY